MASPRAILEDSGYSVRLRHDQWWECVVEGHGELWVGRALHEEAALQNALDQMCPSVLSRSALETPRPATRRAETAASRSELSRAPLLVRREEPGLRNREGALSELLTLRSRIRDSREHLPLCSAERQRLAMMAWICEARSHAEDFPEDNIIREEVAAVSRMLTEIGKAYWPGSVTALQLHMQPRDLPRHMLGGSAPTWRRAAELSEHALTEQVSGDEVRGYDPYGYADAAFLSPSPADPESVLDAVTRELEEDGGPLERGAEAPRSAESAPESETFVRWASTLRWLRLAPVDPERWARALGRVRWWASRRKSHLQPGADRLESGYRPPANWADVLSIPVDETNKNGAATRAPTDAVHRWDGKRIVIVGQRRDPEVHRVLSEALPQVEMEWRMAEPRLMPELVPLITSRRFDAVLAALGLQSASTDHALATACKNASIPYLRVHHGEARSCLRALAGERASP